MQRAEDHPKFQGGAGDFAVGSLVLGPMEVVNGRPTVVGDGLPQWWLTTLLLPCLVYVSGPGGSFEGQGGTAVVLAAHTRRGREGGNMSPTSEEPLG